MKRLLLATQNPGKIKELRHALKHVPIRLVTPLDFKLPKNFVKETGETFTANAVKKAREYSKATGLLTLADDSGLIVSALKSKPGVYSHRFGATTQARNLKLLKLLKNKKNRRARYQAVIAIYNPATEMAKTFSGTADGLITQTSMGKGGFGYDPLFFSLELQKTFGQATIAQKARVSHRGRALAKAIKYLKRLATSD